MKKTLSLFLSLVMLFSITAGIDLSAYAGTSITVSAAEGNISISNLSSDYASKVKSFLSDARWKHGTSWSQISQKLSPYSSKGCCAYVADFAKYVYDYNTPNGKSSHTTVSNIKSGDILKFPNHYIAVLKRNGNQLITAEGAYSNKVRVSNSTYTINESSIYQNGKFYTSTVTVAHYNNVDDSSSASTTNVLSVCYNANGAAYNMDGDYRVKNGLVYKKIVIQFFHNNGHIILLKKTVFLIILLLD
ncbi:MAG: hypothetical protein NC213_08405 [Acetobacter sp.]|nr:hypothetical protein [Bacteroides sp.]MCM1341749.1 hypothetical protein [Acetobacter sp.]MCM1433092.1 hypothetical protein [Clostridiales bacterium]